MYFFVLNDPLKMQRRRSSLHELLVWDDYSAHHDDSQVHWSTYCVSSVPREVLRVYEAIISKAALQLLRKIAEVIEHVTGEMSHIIEESKSVILNLVDRFRKESVDSAISGVILRYN